MMRPDRGRHTAPGTGRRPQAGRSVCPPRPVAAVRSEGGGHCAFPHNPQKQVLAEGEATAAPLIR